MRRWADGMRRDLAFGIAPGVQGIPGTTAVGGRCALMTGNGGTPRATASEWSDRRIPIREDMAFQRASWRAERLAWIAMAVIALAGLAGGLGGASLFGLEAEGRNGDLAVRMPLVARVDAPVRFVIEVTGQPAGAPVDLRFGDRFRGGMAIQDLRPAPEAGTGGREGLVHRHRAGSDGTLRVTIDAKPRSPGWLAFEVATAGGLRVVSKQLVLP